MTTYDTVHAGDVVLGVDGQPWGVAAVTRTARPAVTLVRHGARVTGYPAPGTPVTVAQASDITAEYAAAQVLVDAGLAPELIEETWES